MRTIKLVFVAVAALLVCSASASGRSQAFDWNAAYQAAQPGDTIVVPAGTYGNQVIQYRSSVANLANGCTPQDTSKCIKFVMGGDVSVGTLEIRGSSVWVDGGNRLKSRGYIDTEADSASQHPDHVIVENAGSTAFGVFNADTVTFKNLDVGPQTLGTNCGAIQGSGLENKIGYAGGVVYVPRNVTLDGLRIHNQNVNSAGRASDCHFGGLFLVTVDGLTVKNTIFERNVVYHVQIQNFGGAPAAKRVVFDHNSFGCPVEWLDEKGENTCDGQAAIQFDYDPAGQFTLTNNVAANGTSGLYGCYVGSCGGFGSLIQSGNVNLDASPVAPPLLGGSPPPPPAQCADGKDNDGDGKVDLNDSGCSGASDNDETDPAPTCPGQGGGLTLTKLSETSTTITFGWQPVPNAVGYRFTATATPGKYSHTWDGQRASVKFSKGSACYYVGALLAGQSGGAGG